MSRRQLVIKLDLERLTTATAIRAALARVIHYCDDVATEYAEGACSLIRAEDGETRVGRWEVVS